jgi:hypothetical protein
MSRMRPTVVVYRRREVEPVCRRWIVRLWAATILLGVVLPTCAHPGAAGTAGSGLGMSREALQTVFARQEFAFTFGAPQESRGMPIVSGTVAGRLIALHLVGPPENLTEVTLIVGVPNTDPLAPPAAPKELAENMRYLRAMLQQTVPDWRESVNWLQTQLQGSAERLEVGFRQGHREIVLLAVNHLSMVLLSLRVSQPPAPRRQ